MSDTASRRRVNIASPVVGAEEKSTVLELLDDGRLAGGDEVDRFEADFAAEHDAEYGIATSNGTTALHAGMHALGIGPGDTVVTTPFSFIATANTVRFCGADPVFADIDPETYNLDPAATERTVHEHDADAILAVHLYGHPAPMDELRSIAEENNCLLIEDAAQAHAAAVDGRPVGSLGDVACFSFYPTKNMTTGEGGMVLTDDPDVAERTDRFVDHGRTKGYEHADLGHNFRMTNVEAAIGIGQLDRLESFTEARRENAAALTDGLEDRGADVVTPVEREDVRHVYHQYTVRTPDRDRLHDELDDRGIGTKVYYPIPIPDQPAYEDFDADVPVARRAAEEVLSLPVHPEVSATDVERIIDAVVDVTADGPTGVVGDDGEHIHRNESRADNGNDGNEGGDR
jgi:dTDP-4-amino-4,6-dideoxygalactose transaminase